jgi:hypothetical protein
MRTHPPERFVMCMNFRYYEGYMTVLYLFIKFSYLCNVVVNMILMNVFLQTDDYTVYGIGVLIDLFRGKGDSPHVFTNIIVCGPCLSRMARQWQLSARHHVRYANTCAR